MAKLWRTSANDYHAIFYMLLTAFGADVHIGEPLDRRMLAAKGTQEYHRMASGIMRIET